MNRVDHRFRCMGSEARVRLESAELEDSELERLAARVRALLEDAECKLTRFDATATPVPAEAAHPAVPASDRDPAPAPLWSRAPAETRKSLWTR